MNSTDVRVAELPPPEKREDQPAVFSRRDKTLALAGTLAALFMAGLDQTIVATAGPEIQRDLQIPAALYAWITTAYLIASTVMLPIYGKLSDLYGRKPILLTGVGLFLFGSLLCGFAPTTAFLIGARAVQGLGSASLFTTTLAVIADLFPPNERGKYMGLIGVVMGISSVAGPIVGGLITDQLGWHWIFFINLPVGLVATWLIVTHMPSIGGRDGREIRIDYAGAAWLVLATVPLILAISIASNTSPGQPGWTSPMILGMLGASVLGITGFIRTERTAPEPIIDLQLFRRNPTVARATATMFVLGGTFLFTVIFVPLFLVNVKGESATEAGLSLAWMTAAMVGTSVVAGQLASRAGHVKRILLIAVGLVAVAFFLLYATLSGDSSVREISLMVFLIGLGLGPTLPLYTLLVQNAAEPRQIGAVTSGSIFSRAVGQVMGLAFFGAVFAATLGSALTRGTAPILADVPAAVQPLLLPTAEQGEGEGLQSSVSFDAAAIRARVEADPTLGSAEKSSALSAVDRVEQVFADSMAGAISRLYLLGFFLSLVALALTAWIPVDEGLKPRRG